MRSVCGRAVGQSRPGPQWAAALALRRLCSPPDGTEWVCVQRVSLPGRVIALAVRWYLRYRLSYCEVAEWLAERGVAVDPSTIFDWVQPFTPRFVEAARKHRQRVGGRWRVDETLLKIGGRWRYLFRAIDEHGEVIDVYLSDRRNAASARAFFDRALAAAEGHPSRVTSDKAKCYPPALHAVLPAAEHRCSKYLNNGLEREHQFLKGRVRPMRRFKTMATAHRFCQGHAWVRNLSRGFSDLVSDEPPHLRLAIAWTALALTL